MSNKSRIQRIPPSRNRRGAAAVETAVVAPVLILLFLGAVDAGQNANCYQKVSDAAREGARFAARFNVTEVSQVETAVVAYLEARYPSVSPATLQSTVQVTLCDENGSVLTGDALASVGTGAPIEVNVSLPFDSVRWISGLQILDGRQVQVKAVMRRE